MTKKNKVIFRLLGVFVVLLLVSVCLLGSTFARYTSSGSGTADVTVAKWSISGTYNTGSSGNVEVGTLSPSKAEYDYDGSSVTTERSNVITTALVATVTNNSDVDAKVTLTQGSLSYKDSGGSVITLDTNLAEYDASSTTLLSGTPNSTQMAAIFTVSITLCTSDGGSPATYTEATSIKESDGVYTLASGGATTYYVCATVTWTSYDEEAYTANSSTAQAYADAIDTWIGMNVATIEFTVDYTAVQDSQIPSA